MFFHFLALHLPSPPIALIQDIHAAPGADMDPGLGGGGPLPFLRWCRPEKKRQGGRGSSSMKGSMEDGRVNTRFLGGH